MEDTTMKKTYINPEMEIIKIQSQQQMLAGSLNPGSGSGSVSDTPAPGDVPAEAPFDEFDW